MRPPKSSSYVARLRSNGIPNSWEGWLMRPIRRRRFTQLQSTLSCKSTAETFSQILIANFAPHSIRPNGKTDFVYWTNLMILGSGAWVDDSCILKPHTSSRRDRDWLRAKTSPLDEAVMVNTPCHRGPRYQSRCQNWRRSVQRFRKNSEETSIRSHNGRAGLGDRSEFLCQFLCRGVLGSGLESGAE
jgi:hypothetical protein